MRPSEIFVSVRANGKVAESGPGVFWTIGAMRFADGP
jgi:hypothetical protein